MDGTVISTCLPPDKSTKIMRKLPDEIWFCVEGFPDNTCQGLNGCKVSLNRGIGCCFTHKGDLLVLHPRGRSFLEICIKTSRQKREIANQTLESLLTGTAKETIVAETKQFSNLVISQGGDTVIITDKNGTVKNTFKRPNAKFRSITTDIQGDILVADFQSNFVSVLTEDGIFYREILNSLDNGIKGIEHIDVNESGIMCFTHCDALQTEVYLYK